MWVIRASRCEDWSFFLVGDVILMLREATVDSIKELPTLVSALPVWCVIFQNIRRLL